MLSDLCSPTVKSKIRIYERLFCWINLSTRYLSFQTELITHREILTTSVNFNITYLLAGLKVPLLFLFQTRHSPIEKY